MITNILITLGGGIVGFLVCALFAGGRVLELCEQLDDADEALKWQQQRTGEVEAEHGRAADALSTLHGQRDTIRSIISGNKTVRTSRIAEVIGE